MNTPEEIRRRPRAVRLEPEPAGWRREFPDYIHAAKPWSDLPPEGRAYITAEMAKRKTHVA